jgi:putative NIF3 family GTP cyclohydrolase 1 type 2
MEKEKSNMKIKVSIFFIFPMFFPINLLFLHLLVLKLHFQFVRYQKIRYLLNNIHLLQDKLPKHRGAIQVSGDLNKNIVTVGVCSGSGAVLLEVAKENNLDLFITSDLKHHKVLENHIESGPILISVSHWASEFVWLPNLRNQIEYFLKNYEVLNGVELFEKSTDPWTLSLGSN